MRSKGIQDRSQKIELPRPYVDRPAIGKFFKPHGNYDGKLFSSMDKVTYTFVSNKEVVSLHFDRMRKTIFYKGHNIENLKLESHQLLHLEKFGAAIAGNSETRNFSTSYRDVLTHYLKEHS